MYTRRFFCTALTAAIVSHKGSPLSAKDVVDLSWNDLIPDNDNKTLLDQLGGIGVVEHGQLSTGFEQELADGFTDAFNGKSVRLPGFVVPLEFSASGVTEFILAPFVGACIHVPPPPANQLVFVYSKKPYMITDLFDPVEVTGVLQTTATRTDLAEIGYILEEAKVNPHRF